MEDPNKLVLDTDKEWSEFDGEALRVLHFTPFSSIKNGKILAGKLTDPYPHAILTLECKQVKGVRNHLLIKGYIWHKIDFRHLWTVFEEFTVNENEEVIIFWTKQHYKIRWLRYFGGFPKLRVDICRKGQLEFYADPENWQPESGKRPSPKEMLTPFLSLKWDGME